MEEQLNSFGPNMRLAKRLVEAGRKEAVIEYLKLCANFWTAVSLSGGPRDGGVSFGYAHGTTGWSRSLCMRKVKSERHFSWNLSHPSGLHAAAISSLRPWTRAQLWQRGSDLQSSWVQTHLAIPLSLFVVLSFLLTGWPMLRRRRRKRRGWCVDCGYDLRSAGLTICSECGTVAHPRN